MRRNDVTKGSGRGDLLLGTLVGEFDALLDVALEALNGNLDKLLLLLTDISKGVGNLLDTVGLQNVSVSRYAWSGGPSDEHTPSSTGTEKKSTPVSLAIASPPGTPGR